mgnify:CR=1 FL=1
MQINKEDIIKFGNNNKFGDLKKQVMIIKNMLFYVILKVCFR